VKVLERAGLVRRTRAGREHHIALDPEPIRRIAGWASRYERFWSDRLRQARGIPQSEQKEGLTMPTAGTSSTTPLLRITVPRRIEASPEEVFDAWAEPDLFRRWFEPHRAILRKAAVDELWYWEAEPCRAVCGRTTAATCAWSGPRLLEFAWMSEATRGLEPG